MCYVLNFNAEYADGYFLIFHTKPEFSQIYSKRYWSWISGSNCMTHFLWHKLQVSTDFLILKMISFSWFSKSCISTFDSCLEEHTYVQFLYLCHFLRQSKANFQAKLVNTLYLLRFVVYIILHKKQIFFSQLQLGKLMIGYYTRRRFGWYCAYNE